MLGQDTKVHKDKYYEVTKKYYRTVGNLWGKYIGVPNTIESFRYFGNHEIMIAKKAGITDAGLSVLDCGCGFGQTMAELQRLFRSNKYTGITISAAQVAHHVHPGVTFGNFEELPFANESFDVVYFIESFNHAHSKTKVLKEAYRVLRPGGKLFILDQCVRDEWYSHMLRDFKKKNCYRFHRDFYGASPVSPDYIVRKAQKVGFTPMGVNKDLVNNAQVILRPLKFTLVVEYLDTVYSDFIFQK